MTVRQRNKLIVAHKKIDPAVLAAAAKKVMAEINDLRIRLDDLAARVDARLTAAEQAQQEKRFNDETRQLARLVRTAGRQPASQNGNGSLAGYFYQEGE